MKKIIKYILFFVLLPLLFIFFIFKNPLGLETAIFGGIFLTVGFNFCIGIFAIPIILWRKLAKQTIKYEKLSKEDIIKNNDLYRDILNNFSPAVLSYIDNMSFNFETLVISTLLHLKQKKYISIDNSTIIKLNYSNNIKLTNTEQYILDSISNGKICVSKNTLQNNIIKDSLKENLIKADYNLRKKLLKKFLFFTGLYILIAIIIISFSNYKSLFEMLLFWILLTILGTLPIGSIIYYFTYYNKHMNNPLFRTNKGNELNKKLEGLKNYIREYSLLKEKNDESIELWEDYLIYSIIFGQNTIISKEYMQYITFI